MSRATLHPAATLFTAVCLLLLGALVIRLGAAFASEVDAHPGSRVRSLALQAR